MYVGNRDFQISPLCVKLPTITIQIVHGPGKSVNGRIRIPTMLITCSMCDFSVYGYPCMATKNMKSYHWIRIQHNYPIAMVLDITHNQVVVLIKCLWCHEK